MADFRLKAINELCRVGSALREEMFSAIHCVIESGWYVLCSEVEAFEHEFATYIGFGHAVD